MATQSKSVLIPFLIIAGIVFAVALAWKFLGDHDAEDTDNITEIKQPTSVKKKQTATSTKPYQTAPKTVQYVEPKPYLEPTEEDKEAVRKQAQSNMKFAMRYPTAQKAMEALKNYRDNGNDATAASLIRFIETTYPNDMIPSDLLD